MSSPLYLIAGLGKTGISIARYLQRGDKDFAFFDTRAEPAGLNEIKEEFPQVDIFLQAIPDSFYSRIIEIITSPGVALDHESIVKAITNGIPVIGDIECFAREVTAPVVAITGTNGKSTVTTLVGEILKAAGKRVAVCGNIGTPVLDLITDESHYDVWVLELSSFQLDTTYALAPVSATILNVTPDHLDRHHSFEAYKKAKQRVYNQARYMIYNREDQSTFPDNTNNAELTSFGLDQPKKNQWGLIKQEDKPYLAYGEEVFLSVDELKIKGRHNWQNALAACALTQPLGVKYHDMVEVLKSFSGLPHRSQLVRTIDGVEWINDSKGTNVGATISSLSGIGESITGKIILIAGGQGKGADFRELRESVKKYVRSVILIGEDADKLEAALGDIVNIFHADSLKEAAQIAKTKALPKDAVLLSPACASFDMFRDFNHRGEVFVTVVKSL